jgi:cysteine desulfuration protein SufE
MKSLDELRETFEMLPDWLDRYTVIIDLGKALPTAGEDLHQDHYKVTGCMSQVWVRARVEQGVMVYDGDSDAAIVRGLIAVLFLALSGKAPSQVVDFDLEGAFADLGLAANLSPNRRNGFYSMIGVMKQAALDAA